MSRKIYFGLFAALLILAMGWGALVASAQGPKGGAKSPDANVPTIAVNTTTDEYGAGASCSLREAIRTANTNTPFGGCTIASLPGSGENIIVPAGTYTLTIGGTEDDVDATGDLDITDTIMINGAGSSATIVKGASVWAYRIFQVLTGTVTIQNLTIRDGEVLSGSSGGGLQSELGTIVTLNNVTVTSNIADGNGGGILNRGTMTCNNCSVTNNQTLNSTQGGGGIFNDNNALLTLNTTAVMTNTASGDQGDGGGIYNDSGATLVLSNTTVGANTAQPPGLAGVIANGGGIYSLGLLTITLSTISNNQSKGGNAVGGGIFCSTIDALIDRSLISGNTAVQHSSGDITAGGGIASNCKLTIKNSIISNNTADTKGIGGGLELTGNTHIVNSTINGNHAVGGVTSPTTEGLGGGIYTTLHITLTNTTVSGNDAGSNGGGIHVAFASTLSLFNATIMTNTSNVDNVNGGTGGGVYVNATGGSATVTMSNSVLSGNLENGAGTHDDCDGTINSGGYNLVENTSGCTVTGGGGTDQLGVSALLNALANNGGFNAGANGGTPILTHAPQSTSPLINTGNPGGCRDLNNILLATDERGFLRPVGRCDIGAFEYQLRVFLPLIVR